MVAVLCSVCSVSVAIIIYGLRSHVMRIVDSRFRTDHISLLSAKITFEPMTTKHRSESQVSQLGDRVVEDYDNGENIDDGHGRLEEELRNVAIKRIKNNKSKRKNSKKIRVRKNSI